MAFATTANAKQKPSELLHHRTSQSGLRMAGQSLHQNFGAYLDSNQQDLLIAALNSQAKKPRASKDDLSNATLVQESRNANDREQTSNMADSKLFMSPLDAGLDSFDYTPDLDYLDGESGFDFENADLGGEMIGALPGASSSESPTGSPEQHEKRKNPDADSPEDASDPKRQETQEGEKQAKKPGRKPLTSEPTTKRKAQNRAAQRAFRERKEKHVKDLETKVNELTKSREADQHENGLLKAQVDRLQSELRDYRKRLSLDRTGGSRQTRSPPHPPQQRSSNGASYNAPFQFDFPKFGSVGGGQAISQSPADSILEKDNLTPNSLEGSPMASLSYSQSSSRHASQSQSVSPGIMPRTASTSSNLAVSQAADQMPSTGYSTAGNMHGFAGTLPTMNNDIFNDLFSPSILKGVGMEAGGYFNDTSTGQELNGGEMTAGLSRTFQFNSGSMSDSASPSTTVSSQWNANCASSSCGTSPEPSHGSPTTKDKNVDTNADKQSSQLRNVTNQDQLGNTNSLFGGIDFSVPSANTFDPVLFGDYRDTSSNVFGTNELSGGLFDDALNVPFDLGSPSNLFGILSPPKESSDGLKPSSPNVQAPTPSATLMAQIEKARDGDDDDYGLTTAQGKKASDGKLVSCNNIWNQLQSNPDFQDGKFDLDGLCSELRAKARCSESGVMVAEKHVDAAIRKLGQKDVSGAPQKVPNLMFEQDSWDKVLKKLSGNAQT